MLDSEFNALIKQAHKTALEHGWWEEGPGVQVKTFGDYVSLGHTELSEAYEEYRKGYRITEIYYNEDKPDKPEGIPIEIADEFIRWFDFCGHMGIDLLHAILLKMEFNEGRPYRHGGKLT